MVRLALTTFQLCHSATWPTGPGARKATFDKRLRTARSRCPWPLEAGTRSPGSHRPAVAGHDGPPSPPLFSLPLAPPPGVRCASATRRARKTLTSSPGTRDRWVVPLSSLSLLPPPPGVRRASATRLARKARTSSMRQGGSVTAGTPRHCSSPHLAGSPTQSPAPQTPHTHARPRRAEDADVLPATVRAHRQQHPGRYRRPYSKHHATRSALVSGIVPLHEELASNLAGMCSPA